VGSKTLASHPIDDSFSMPGEFSWHAGAWMAWPERPDNWRNNAQDAQRAYATVAEAVATFEPVTMCVSIEQWEHARATLSDRVRVIELSTDDAWLRDQGPTFVINDARVVRGVDWQFNAWGELYKPYHLDHLVARKILEVENIDRYAADFVLEGGAIHVDGEGTLLTTDECLLNPNRNPHLGKSEIEQRLKSYLGVRKVIWLSKGVYMDEDTNGHVDNLCCFVRPGVVALTWTDDVHDPQYEISRDAYDRLTHMTDAKGRSLSIHKIQQPSPMYTTAEECPAGGQGEGELVRLPGTRLAASYINFYIANGGIVMPAFNDPQDEIARDTVSDLFPDRRVVTVPTREILLGGGNIHCIIQQQPSGSR
jgi:agmatine deiminase